MIESKPEQVIIDGIVETIYKSTMFCDDRILAQNSKKGWPFIQLGSVKLA